MSYFKYSFDGYLASYKCIHNIIGMPCPSLDGAFLLGLFSKKPRTCAVPSTRTMSPIRVLIFPVSTMIGRVTGKRSLSFSWINSSQDLARTYFFHRMQTDSQLLGYCHRGMCCELFFNYTFFFVFYLFG